METLASLFVFRRLVILECCMHKLSYEERLEQIAWMIDVGTRTEPTAIDSDAPRSSSRPNAGAKRQAGPESTEDIRDVE